MESRCSIYHVQVAFSPFRPLKSIAVPFHLPILPTDDNTYSAISENSIALWNTYFLSFVIVAPSYALPTRTSRPPRRLSPRFPRRFSRRLPIVPPACRSHQLHTARVDFSERPSCRSRDVVTVRSVPARRLHMPAYIAFGHRIVPRNHIASRRPCRLAVPIWRRLVCLVAWLREGRGGRA